MKFSRVLSILAALFATVLLVALGIVRFHEETATYRPVVPPYELFWCAKNEDCAVVDRIGCCSCRDGGAQAAVTAWRRDDLDEFLDSACQPLAQQVCVQLDLCRDGLSAECKDRRCRVVENGND